MSPSRYRRRALTWTMPKNLASRLNGKRLGARHDDVERREELLERHLEGGAQPLVLQRRDAGFDVVLAVEAVDAALQEEVADTLASVGELRQLVRDALEQSFEVIAGVRGERLLQMLADSVVVDDVADVLA